MQSQPRTRREIIAVLRTEVARAQRGGLSRKQALVAVSYRFQVNPIMVEALLWPGNRNHA